MAMREMSDRRVREFLLEGTRTGKLATVREDGRPHVVPIWFILRDGHTVFNTSDTSVKATNLARDSRAALSVDDQTPPYSFVTVEGTATLSADDPDLEEIATEIGARYMGSERAEEFGKRNAAPGELVVRLSMNKVISAEHVAD